MIDLLLWLFGWTTMLGGTCWGCDIAADGF